MKTLTKPEQFRIASLSIYGYEAGADYVQIGNGIDEHGNEYQIYRCEENGLDEVLCTVGDIKHEY